MNTAAPQAEQPTVEEFSVEASAWLAANATRKPVKTGNDSIVWGRGEFSTSIFHALSFDDEKAVLDELKAWNQKKAARGYHAIAGSTQFGGLGLSKAHARAFGKLESEYLTPARHETYSVTVGLIAPSIRVFGTPEQQKRWVAMFTRTDALCCQLFSEPGAGSDLASLACRAERDGDEWVVNGQKVWSSGAQFSEWGLLIARTDPDVVKHAGLTAYVIPMDLPGIEIRPIKQMSGGSSFNEVFFSDVRVPDSLRLGDIGAGWKVALTVLSFERDHSDSSGNSDARAGGSWKQLLATAQWLGRTSEPVMRQKLIDTYIHTRVEHLTNKRAADLARGGTPGPEGSLGKLLWTQGMTRMGDVVSELLGPRILADTGEWGTFAWTEHLLGAPGYRIAGGSDEVQRNIIGERVLGLPGEPRVDKDVTWRNAKR